MSSKSLPLLRHVARTSTTLSTSRSRIPAALILPSRIAVPISSTRIRHNSTQPQSSSQTSTESAEKKEASKPPNPHRNFYKEFGRPVSKVFLMAVLTYQFVYFFWAQLEADEIIKEKEVKGEVKELESKLESVLAEKGKPGKL